MGRGVFRWKKPLSRLCVTLSAGLLLLLMAASSAHAEGWSAARSWLERDTEVFGLTNGQLVMIGGGAALVGGAVLLAEPALAGGILGGLVFLEAAKLAVAAGVGGALALGYDLEEDLGIPPVWKKVPRFWEGWTGRSEAPSP